MFIRCFPHAVAVATKKKRPVAENDGPKLQIGADSAPNSDQKLES